MVTTIHSQRPLDPSSAESSDEAEWVAEIIPCKPTDAEGDWSRLRRFSCVDRAVYPHIARCARSLRRRALRVLVVPATRIEIVNAWLGRAHAAGLRVELTLALPESDPKFLAQVDDANRNGFAIECLEVDCLQTCLPGGFDLVVSVHFLHQLRPDQTFRQLQHLIGASAGPLVVCDYARSNTNLWLAGFGTHVFMRDPKAREEVLNRIRQAYSIDEIRDLAESALARKITVKPVFPCHFVMTCEEQVVTEPVAAFA